MKAYLTIFLSLFLAIILSGCGKAEKDPVENETAISPDQFTDRFLAGDFEALYNQTSDDFQDMVTLESFIELGEGFNADVEGFELVSEMPIDHVTEYQWISERGDKGIRSYFSEDHTIEGMQLMPLSVFPESDEKYTENIYQMPINEEWYTFWGGTNELVNYHYAHENQRYAYDLLIVEAGNSFDGDSEDNESYFAFGKEVLAPLEGVVVSTENSIPENTPLVETNAEEPLGNHVIIEHKNNEYSVIAHLQENSLQVSEGDSVAAGDVVGLAGNSGNSSEPHIHFHVADGEDWENATSIRINFKNGEEPVRGETTTGF